MAMNVRILLLVIVVFGATGCSKSRPQSAQPVPSRQSSMETTQADFLRVSGAYGAGSSKIVSRDDLQFGELVPNARDTYEISAERMASPKRQPGDFLGRIWSLYGPPGSGETFEIFHYDFLDRKTGILFTATSGKSGPSYGGASKYVGPYPPPAIPGPHVTQGIDRAVFLEVVKRFEALLAQASLAECMLVQKNDDGLFRVGARGGKPFEEKLSFTDSIDFYIDLVKRFGPERDIGAYHLAYPERQIRSLWVHATDTERQQRPAALGFARHAWERELEKLEKSTVKRTSDLSSWRLTWEALDGEIRVVGADTPDHRRRLDRLRQPPPVPTTALEDEAREEGAMLELLKKRAASKPGGERE